MLNPIITQAIEFTNTYKQYKDAPVPIREAMCYKMQYKLLPDIREGDIFAGHRTPRRVVYVGSMLWIGMPNSTPERLVEGKQGGYCFDYSAVHKLPQNAEEKEILQDLTEFWKNECTTSKLYAFTDSKNGTGYLFANNLKRLVEKGLPGLKDDVNNMPEGDMRTGLLIVLDTITDICRMYQKQAEDKGYTDMAKNLSAIIEHAPKTLAQALQLILLYEMLSHERHYEINALDTALGDLYVHEIDSGNLTQEEAIEQILAFFRMIRANGDLGVCRMVMGGRYRPNIENADRFIEAAFIAEQRHKEVIPQVSLRIYDGMNPNILKLAYETINETGTFPTLYNEDAIMPGVAQVFETSDIEARDFYPLGCGEYIIAHKSPAILVLGWNIPKTVNEGIYAANAENFEELYKSVLEQIRQHAKETAHYHRLVIDTNKNDCAFLLASLLTDDCLQRGKPILDGGARYNGACIMGHGFTNAADSLTAIKKLVYEQKIYTLQQIIEAMNKNFEGYDSLRKALTDVPKYGNDDDEADKMLARLWSDISDETQEAGKAYGLDFHTVSSVNPGGYRMGSDTGATADGRLANEPFAIGNAPTAGADKSGLTALMNTIIKTNINNGGTVTNFKLSRDYFTRTREKFESMFRSYWKGGGLQANVTIVNKGDLEAAMKAPEKFPHLMVRLGGWTARFIDLDRQIQTEILQRTLY